MVGKKSDGVKTPQVEMKITNFINFVDENHEYLEDNVGKLFKDVRKLSSEKFIAHIAAWVYPFYVEGKLEHAIDESAKHYCGKTFAECCEDKEVREKFIKYLRYFCVVVRQCIQLENKKLEKMSPGVNTI